MAYKKAAKGKRGLPSAASFDHKIADRLIDLRDQLRSDSYRPGAYTHFFIHEPKQRKISAAPFRDRVVHHAVCNVIEPAFEELFHPHSYANRKGKGTHRAIDQLQHYARRYRYCLRLDIVQHFPSIDHQILRDTLFSVVTEPNTQNLMQVLLASGQGVLADQYEMTYFAGDTLLAPLRPRGLPIGNLTSQFWSNCYLNRFDQFVKREIGCSAYVRYVDDMALFSNSKKELLGWKQAIVARLSRLRLRIHASAAQVSHVQHGIPWLGWVVYPTHRRVKRRNVVNFHRRLKNRYDEYQSGQISFGEFDASIQGWINHVRYGDTWGLRQHLLPDIVL